jgi:hypothetical protein
VDFHALGRLRSPPLLPLILVVTEELLLLRVDRYDWPLRAQRLAHLLVDVLKLSVPIWVVAPLLNLAVPLKAVVHLP